MSRYVWLAVVVLVVATATILFWIDRSDRPEATAPPMPSFHELDGGEWHPHPDRAGLPRHRQTQ